MLKKRKFKKTSFFFDIDKSISYIATELMTINQSDYEFY